MACKSLILGGCKAYIENSNFTNNFADFYAATIYTNTFLEVAGETIFENNSDGKKFSSQLSGYPLKLKYIGDSNKTDRIELTSGVPKSLTFHLADYFGNVFRYIINKLIKIKHTYNKAIKKYHNISHPN